MIALRGCRTWLWAAFLVLMGMDAGRAGVEVIALDDKGRFARIEISGKIVPSDVDKFALLVSRLRPDFEIVDVDLNSSGGDVLAAMQIGEIVRREWLWTTVPDGPPPKGCLSACVLILAAGAVRVVSAESRVGIHRPYFDHVLFAGLDRAQAKSKYDALSQSVAAYLAKMGIPERLYQEMMKVPSSEVRVLSYDDMTALNLDGPGPGLCRVDPGEERCKVRRGQDEAIRCLAGSSGRICVALQIVAQTRGRRAGGLAALHQGIRLEISEPAELAVDRRAGMTTRSGSIRQSRAGDAT